MSRVKRVAKRCYTYSSANSVKPPIVEGIVPLNLLESSPLKEQGRQFRAYAVAKSLLMECVTTHTYVSSVALPMVDEMEPVKALS